MKIDSDNKEALRIFVAFGLVAWMQVILMAVDRFNPPVVVGASAILFIIVALAFIYDNLE